MDSRSDCAHRNLEGTSDLEIGHSDDVTEHHRLTKLKRNRQERLLDVLPDTN